MTDLRKAAAYTKPGAVVPVNIETTQLLVDALRQALAQPDEVLAEREACARLVEADGLARGNEGLVFIKAAGRIRARSEKPPVKTYCGGKANYCTPEVTPDVDAVNISQERVDETAKGEHNPWPSVQCVCGGTIYFKYTLPISDYHEGWEEGFKAAKREWVGLTYDDVHDAFKYVEMVKLLDFDRDRPEWCEAFARACEATLRHRNGDKR